MTRLDPTRARLLCGALAALALVACDDGGEVGPPALAADAGVGADGAAASASITLVIEARGLAAEAAGPLRVIGTRMETGEKLSRLLGDGVEGWPARFTLDDLAPGTWRLTAYRDRDDDAVFDACPFPPMPADVERADAFDNLNGVVEATVGADAEVALVLERRICGPGDVQTGATGELVPPADADLSTVPVFALFEPLDSFRPAEVGADAGVGAAPGASPDAVPLRVPLFPDGLAGPARFEVGELVPGIYRITFFADADGDRAPSLCGTEGLGGGDRFAQVVERFQVVAGQRSPLGAPVELAEAPCPEDLTGLTGTLALTEALDAVLAAEPEALEVYGLLTGPVRLALVPTTGGEPVSAMPLLGGVGERPLPHRFTVTGLPPGAWRLVVWLDRDRDGLFAPCNGLPAGLDAVYRVREDVYVQAGHVVDLGSVVLDRGECDIEAPTGVQGRVRVDTEQGSVGSGRPVRLDLLPEGGAGERRSFLLFENHRALPSGGDDGEDGDGDPPPGGPYARFTVSGDVPPGRYRALAYVDFDRDGAFVPCSDAPFADRLTSGVLGRCDGAGCPTVEVEAGALVNLGALDVTSLGCEVPQVSVEPTVRLAQRLGPESVDDAALRLVIEEAGGWRDDRILRERLEDPTQPLVGPALRLAPGRYRLTAYVDADGDERFGACDAGGDTLWAQIEVVLGEAMADGVADLVLDRRCPL